MKKTYPLLTIVFTFLAAAFYLQRCSNSEPQRFSDEIFSDSDYPAGFDGAPENPIEVTYGQNYADSAYLWDDDAGNDDLTQVEDLKMDIYLPPPSDTLTKRPVMIFVHGGGFVQGDKASGPVSEMAPSFAKRGWVVISANYRLFPLAKIAEENDFILEQEGYDIKAAVRWIKKHADEYDADAERIGLGGTSAGGFISVEVGYNNNPSDSPAEHGEGDSNDLFTTDGIHSDVLAVANMWGGGSDFTNIVDADDPPAVVVHCNQDPVVPHIQVAGFVNAIKDEDIPFSSDDNLIPGASHGLDTDLVLPVIAPFLAKYVAGAEVGDIPTLRSLGTTTCPEGMSVDN